MKSLLLSLAAIGALTHAEAQEKNHQHCFGPKFFYRHHDETNYEYDTWGVGLQYHLKRPEGIHVKLSVITNPQDKNVLTESENALYYKALVSDNAHLYPIFTHRLSTHNVGHKDDKICNIHKHTFFAGIGAEILSGANLHFRAELQGFRDLFNAVHVRQSEHYWGRSFSNPYGARAKIGLSADSGEHTFFDMEGYYARTFSKCYEEYGCELSVNWGF